MATSAAGVAPQEYTNISALLLAGEFERWAESFHVLGRSEPDGSSNQLKAVNYIREHMELMLSPEHYERFLRYIVIGVFVTYLQTTPTSFVTNNEHRIRNTMLEIISRLALTELLRPHVRNITKVIMYLLTVENEENAVVCLRILSEFHRVFRQALEPEVPPFLDYVYNLYRHLPHTVSKVFNAPAQTVAEHSMQDGGLGAPSGPEYQRTLLHATSSFKTLAECPVLIVLLHQLYPAHANNPQWNYTRFMPVAISALTLQAPTHASSVHRSSLVDLITCQVKTLSFIAFFARAHVNEMRAKEDEIARGVMQLLRNCPPEASSVRRELLVAIRHIWGTELRRGFIPHLNTLLEDNTLIGTGRTTYETLRYFAYCALADLLHHLRNELQIPQFVRIVQLYSRNLHDSTLLYSMNHISVKMLLNLIEVIAKRYNENKNYGDQCRDILLKILDAFHAKFAHLKRKIPKLLEEAAAYTEKQAATKDQPILNPSDGPSPVDMLRECRALLRSLLLGLKNLMWGFGQVANTAAAGSTTTQVSAASVNVPGVSTITILTKLVRDVLRCFSVYAVPDEGEAEISSTSTAIIAERKEAFDFFGGMLTMVDPQTFIDIITPQLPFFYERFCENPALIILFEHLLQSPATSRYFMDSLLNFLMDKMQLLSSNDKKESTSVGRLFKLVFSAIAFSEDAEPILQVNLTGIFTQAMRLASETKDPTNYYLLLRNLLRSLGQSRNEILSKEFLPYLGNYGLFENLNRLQNSSHPQQLKDLFMELVLTAPLRMTSVTTCLRHFMKPLLLSIETNESDIMLPRIGLGLKVLETFVDRLSPELLEPVMADIKPRLMRALWKHLRPTPYPYAGNVVRIMGKMSGRSRNFLMAPPQLTITKNTDSGLLFEFKLDPSVTVELSLHDVVYAARKLLLSNVIYPTIHIPRHQFAYSFFKAIVSSLLDASDAVVDSYYSPEYISTEPVALVQFETPARTKRIKTAEQLDSERHILKIALSCILISSTLESLKDTDAKAFCDKICTHFGILASLRKEASTERLQEISPKVFQDALLDVLCSENRDHSASAIRALEHVYHVSLKFANDDTTAASSIPFFDELADRFCSCCYMKDWYMKAGGVAGISYFTSNLSREWLLRHQVNFMRALLFVSKDLLQSVAFATVEEASQTLTALIKACYSNDRMDASNGNHLDEALSLLASQLLTSSPAVRKNVQAALELLAELTGNEVTELLEKQRDVIFGPIFAQPLKKNSIKVQTGYLEALTFCLNLRPPLVPNFEDLKNVLTDATVIADQDEQQQVRMNKQIHNHRVASIELLAAAIDVVPELQENEELRNRIIQIFFKLITSRQKPVVQAAKKGLEQVFAWPSAVSKDVCNPYIKTILANISETRKLSEPLLEGFQRIIAMIPKAFNAPLFDRVLTHLRTILKPAELSRLRPWKPGEEIRIAALCVDLFSVPYQFSAFIDPLVNIVIDLEAQLHELAAPTKKPVARELTSPFRDGLAKFLARYPSAAVDFFIKEISTGERADAMCKMFRYMLCNEHSGLLREEMIKSPEKLLVLLQLLPLAQNQFPAYFYGVSIVKTILKFCPDWLAQYPVLLSSLLSVWESADRKMITDHYDNPYLFKMRTMRDLIKCLLSYCKANPEQPEVLYKLLPVFTSKNWLDNGRLEDYLTITIPQTYTAQQKRAVLQYFVSFFTDVSVSDELKAQAVRVIVNPLLQHIFEKNEEGVLDKQLVLSIVGAATGTGDEKEVKPERNLLNRNLLPALQLELMRMLILFIRYRSSDIVELKKSIIRCAWTLLQLEDPIIRNTAYLQASYIVNKFDSPPKLIGSVFLALLKTHQSEVRAQVREALDTIIAAPNWLRLEPKQAYPQCVILMRRAIIEEGHSVQQLVHIYQLIVRHPAQFYPWRVMFIHGMVSSLSKLGLSPNASNENRRLALSIVDLLIKWERRRIEEQESAQADETTTHPTSPASGMQDTASPPISPANQPSSLQSSASAAVGQALPPSLSRQQNYKLQPAQIDVVILFLTRTASAGESARDPTLMMSLANTAMRLLRDALTIWPTATIPAAYIGKLMIGNTPGQEQAPQAITAGLNLLDTILEHRTESFVSTYLATLDQAMPNILTNNLKIVEAFGALLTKLVKAYPPTPDSPVNSIYAKISDYLTNTFNSEGSWECPILLLKSICEQCSSFIVPISTAAVKYFIKMVKDYIAPKTPEEMNPTAPNPAAPNVPKKSPRPDTNAILTMVNILAKEMQSLGDNKKQFFAAVCHLIDKSADYEGLLLELLKIVKTWLCSKSLISPKDKGGFIQRLRRFEKIQHPRTLVLHKEFMDIVYNVWTDDSINPSDVPGLEQAFLMGMVSRDASIRHRFVELFLQRLPPDLTSRFNVLLSSQTWGQYSHIFWIQPALDALLALVGPEDALKLSPISSRVPPISAPNGDPKCLHHLPPSAQALVKEHMAFLEEIKNIKAQALVQPLREVLFYDAEMSMQMWASLFASLWDNHWNDNRREEVKNNIFSILSQDWILKQSRTNPNIVQALLHGFFACQVNRPVVPAHILKFVAGAFNSWHLSIRMFEEQLAATPPEEDPPVAVEQALADLYSRLGETDHYYGMLYELALTEDSKAALILEQLGMWQRAQEVYYQAMHHAHIGVIQNVPPREQELWESHWIDCAKHLGQWDILLDYGKLNNMPELIAEAAWKAGDWISLKEVFTKHAFSPDSLRMRIYQALMCLHESKMAEVDTLLKQVINGAMAHWSSLPRVPCAAHVRILHQFQQTIELWEAAKNIKELAQHRLAKLPEIKKLINGNWRDRLLNEYDDITMWHDIMEARQHVFSIINHIVGMPAQGESSALPYLGYHEAAWTINKRARVARRQGLVEVCLSLLTRIYQLPNIDLQDAFNKLNEQIKCYNELPSHYRTAIDIINSTNLKYFASEYLAEFFQLKGEFLRKLGAYEEANTSLGTALGMSNNLAKGWISWGRFHDERLRLAVSTGNEADTLKYANYALSCYMEAVKCSTQHSCRKYLARALWLLRYERSASEMASIAETGAGNEEIDEAKPETSTRKREAQEELSPPPNKRIKTELGESQTQEDSEHQINMPQTPTSSGQLQQQSPTSSMQQPPTSSKRNLSLVAAFADQAKMIPSWVWVQWIPVLVRALQRIEAPAVKTVLSRVVMLYPHALYYPLNTYIQELRALLSTDSEMDVDTASKSQDGTKSHMLSLREALQHAEEVMELLSNKYATLPGDLRRIVNAIETLCEPTLLEEILSMLEQLQHYLAKNIHSPQCYAIVKRELGNIHKFYFGDNSKRLTKEEKSIKKELTDLKNHHDVSSPQFALALTAAIRRVRWLVQQQPQTIEIERKIPGLFETAFDNYYEIPGLSFAEDREPAPDFQVSMERIESPVRVIRSPHGIRRSLTIRGHNGKLYHFLVQTANRYPLTQRLEGMPEPHSLQIYWSRQHRLLQEQRFMNKVFARNVQTCRRGLVLTTPATAQLSLTTRIIPVDSNGITLNTVCERWCVRNGVDPDMPVNEFFKLSRTGAEHHLAAERCTWLQTANSTIPDSMLINYVYAKIVDSYDAIWTFRKYFTMQLAGWALIQYMYGAAEKAIANGLLFSPETGQIYVHDVVHKLDSETGALVLPSNKYVPFRLTRNLRKLLGPAVHASQFEATLTAALAAITREHPIEVLSSHLRLHQRDDIVDWALTHGWSLDGVNDLAEKNAEEILRRLLEVKPKLGLNEPLTIKPANSKVAELVEMAISNEHLANTDGVWAPWI